MLSTSNLSAAQAENYYSQDDYYAAEAEESVGQWCGKGSAALGLSGSVEKQVFKQLLQGVAPDGQVLSGRTVSLRKRRAATDFTFSAPKSVSLAALVQGDRRVLQAHQQAVHKALSVTENRYAQTRISTLTGRQRTTTANLVIAVFPHATSREMEPQLHTHCVVMNATQLPDGQWRSFSNEAAIAHQKLLGQIYQNELAFALRQLGYQVEQRSHGQFELKGYSSELLKLFSTRRQQIQELIATWEGERQGLNAENRSSHADRARRETATLMSRKRKTKTIDAEKLVRGWNALIRLKGLELPTLPEQSIAFPETSLARARVAVSQAVAHCSERETVFRQSHLERFVFEHHGGMQSFDDLQQAIQENLELIRIDANQYTTQTAIGRELDTIRLMQQGKEQIKPIATLDQGAQLLQQSPTLTAGQQEAITLAVTTNDRIISWQGVAGSGKSHSLRVLQQLARSQGFTVKGFAPSAEAAHGLEQATGIQSDTVASLIHCLTNTNQTCLNLTDIWIIDEASLLSAKDAHILLQQATEHQVRILLVGDTRQLSAIEAGNPFRSLQAGGMKTTYLDENLRQQNRSLKTAVNLIAQNRVVEGVQELNRAGCIQEIEEPDRRMQQVVEDYLSLSIEERDRTLLLCGTHRDRLELTQKIRQALQVEGRLEGDGLPGVGLRPKNLTRTQACYASTYEVDDVIVPLQDYRRQGLLKSQQYGVMAIDRTHNQLVLETPAKTLITIQPHDCRKKTVYQPMPISIAVGDRLKWTKNDRTLGICNGQTFTVTQIEPDGTAQILDQEGHCRLIDLNENQYFDHAWVNTIYSSQGKTCDRVLALMDDATTNRESFYVTVSRAKHELTLYTADKAELIQQVQTSKTKKNVSDYIHLFQVAHHAQTSKNQSSIALILPDDRNSAEPTGSSLGAGTISPSAIPEQRDNYFKSASCSNEARSTTVKRNLAAGLEQHLAPLAEAIADYYAERTLIECARDLTAAVAAVNCSIKHLEQSAQNRTQLTTAVDRLDAAVRGQARNGQSVEGGSEECRQPFMTLSSVLGGLQHRPEGVLQRSDVYEAESSDRERYQKMWQHYREGVKANNPVQLDYRVAHRAVATGQHCQREIALMLAAGSPHVAQIHQRKGKNLARNYVNQVAKTVCLRMQTHEGITIEISL